MPPIVSFRRRSLVVPVVPGSGMVRVDGRRPELGNGSFGELSGGVGYLPRPRRTEGSGIGNDDLFCSGTGKGSSLGKVRGVVPVCGWRSMVLVGSATPSCSSACFLAICSVKTLVSKRIG